MEPFFKHWKHARVPRGKCVKNASQMFIEECSCPWQLFTVKTNHICITIMIIYCTFRLLLYFFIILLNLNFICFYLYYLCSLLSLLCRHIYALTLFYINSESPPMRMRGWGNSWAPTTPSSSTTPNSTGTSSSGRVSPSGRRIPIIPGIPRGSSTSPTTLRGRGVGRGRGGEIWSEYT